MADAPSPLESSLFIEKEMKDSYLSYAMSVIVSRALPDVRDGLKPSQRRVLVAMNDLNLGPRSKYKKCAKVAGDTSGNYHPHGESVVYPTLVRLAQTFNMRVPLVDGQGNFGSVDGDPPAAMRYTECRMASAASALMEDINEDTVDFVPNYDGSRDEPIVLPSTFPNLLVNGSSGIAVGMATNVPPHNPREICAALQLLIEKPDAGVNEIMELVPGPDFPTGGILGGQAGVRRAYATGRGTTVLRGRCECLPEEGRSRARILVTEIPYQVNKATLIQSIAGLVKDGRITSIHDVQDHSDRDGMRIVVDLKKGEDPEVTLNQLYKFTQLQITVSIINIALVDQRPRTLSLPQMMHCFLDHRRQVVRRRTQYRLAQARARQHIVEGLRIAVQNIDEVIAIIRGASDPQDAMARLRERFDLSEKQSEAIVNMRLRALTSLEVDKLEAEWRELADKIARFEAILADPKLVDALIVEDLDRMATAFPAARRTEIGAEIDEIEDEDLIPVENVVVTVSNAGYVKRMTLDTYRSQRRGGSGVRGGESREGDFIDRIFLASTHDSLLFLTSSGKVYALKVYRLPDLGRTAMGRALVNLLPGLSPDDSVQAVIPVQEYSSDEYLLFVTAAGVVKRTSLWEYRNQRQSGLIAIGLDETDSVIDVVRVRDGESVVLCTRNGRAIHFEIERVRAMGRPARGVRGIRLLGDDRVCGVAVTDTGSHLLTVCEHGYGKRTPFEDYPIKGRGGQGVIDIRTTARNGRVVAVRAVDEEDDVIYVTQRGQVVRTPVRDISSIGRNTQGVRLITVKADDTVASLGRIRPQEDVLDADEAVAPAAAGDGDDEPPAPEGDDLAPGGGGDDGETP